MTTGSDQFSISQIIVNQPFNMNNNKIINLATAVNNNDAISKQQSENYTNTQIQRIGEIIVSPISNLQNYYSYLLRCDNQVFNTTTYPILYQRLQTNQLIQGYQMFNDSILIYSSVPASGDNNFMILTWNAIINNSDFIEFHFFDNNYKHLPNSPIIWHCNQILVATSGQQTNSILMNVYFSQDPSILNTNLLDITTRISIYPSIIANYNTNNQFNFSFRGQLNGMQLRIYLRGLRNSLQKNFAYIITQ